MNTTTSDAQDLADMARLCAGHESALNGLMERHAGRLSAYLVRVLQDEAEASDLAQESFVRVYLHRDRFKPAARFSTWIYAIATNLARDRLRRISRHPHVSMESPQPDAAGLNQVLAIDEPNPHESLVFAERAAAVRNAVAELPEDLRVPLILSEYEDQSNAEIAAVLDCSAKAVEMRLYRARQQLRTKLGPLLQSAPAPEQSNLRNTNR
ncbi:MAG TPA: sigma-70 family RNA polymerase sigma factor [Verrucomicrobiae bacterium]|nr:sigma-70 family RNA polymerase sigma factor [Verrucomicrobiae bacterium]